MRKQVSFFHSPRFAKWHKSHAQPYLLRPLCVRARARGARPWPSSARGGKRGGTAAVLASDASVSSLLSARVIKWRDGAGRQSHGHPGFTASLTLLPSTQNASSDASLPDPPLRPGTLRPLVRLLHPELPPWRQEGAAGGRQQTGL